MGNLGFFPIPFTPINRGRRKGLSVFLAVLLALQSGCAVWRPLHKAPAAPALPPGYEGYYDYPKGDYPETLVLEEKTKSYVMRRYEFPLNLAPELYPEDPQALKARTEELFKTDQKTANDQKLQYLNRVDLYLPANLKPGEKRPAILISPILGGNMVVDHFARYYAGRGYIAAIVHRKKPYLTDNAPDLEGVEHYLRSSVIRLREAVDWLSARPEVDADRLGAFGVSYGAILHAVLAAVEPRIRYHVLAMPAGPLPDVIIECPDAMLAKLVRKVHEEYGWPRDKIYGELKEHIRTDPILLAPYIPKDKVQVYVAAFDRVVGARRSFGLWKAMGKPSLKVLPFGHYGGILVFPLLETQSYLAFRKHLKPAPPAPRN